MRRADNVPGIVGDVKVHEYPAREILRRFGVPVPDAAVAFGAADAADAFRGLNVPRAFVKAQDYTGGRGRGGGVTSVTSAGEAEAAAGRLVGARLNEAGREGRIPRQTPSSETWVNR